MEWISIKDRLPEKKITSVIVYGNLIRVTALFDHGVFYPDWQLESNEVTHWMPLPEPPKN